jgi:predicted GIY-YIG superfamily endonuclease
MGFVYILQSENGKFYIGSTNNIVRRYDQHKHGHTWSTQRFKNFKLVFSQEFPTLAIARKIELKLKRLKRKDYIEKNNL